MGQQIVRRKKRGRPSNSDLTTTTTHRSSAAVSFNHRRLRRSSRRRSTFKYNIIDSSSSSSSSSNSDEEEEADFNSEDETEDEEIGRRRRERKLKLVLKLNNTNRGASRGVNGVCSRNRRRKLEESEEEEEEEEERVKKRRISVNDCEEGEEEGGEEDEEDEGRRQNGEQEKDDSGPGTPMGRSVMPLLDKKRLELILDKLQKKDSYGVYAEPVDPEELPDYHDVIEHPMDFSTIRKNLANGSYSSLEQFESDVFLICSNAMLYNASETIYHKQARAIKELAEKKFQHIRDDFERLEKEVKAEQVPKPEPSSRPEPTPKPEPMPKPEPESKSNSSISKQMRTQISRSTQERIGSDHISDAAPLATADPQKAPISVHVGSGEKQCNNGGHLEGSSSLLVDNTPEKLEDQQSGKSLVPKLGKRSSVVDENRRQSYDPSNQPLDSVDSIFMTFEGEKKQLISVGLQGEHSYARSLARFAGTLGPVAWKFASKRIEQALPPGLKFGRGWVGEYEPLPTPLLFHETRPQKDPFSMKLQGFAACNNENFSRTSVPANRHVLPAKRSNFDVKPSGGSKPPTPKSVANKQQNPLSRKSMPLENKYMQQSPVSWDPVPTESKVAKRAKSQGPATVSRDSIPLEGKVEKRAESNSMATTVSRDSVPQEIKVVKRVEYHSPTIANQNGDHTARNLPCAAEMPFRSMDPMTRSKSSMQQLPFKQPEVNGFVVPGGLWNEKSINSSLDINHVITSPRSISSPRVVGQASFPWRQEQGLSDSVQVMRNVSEQTRKPPNGSSPYLGPLHVRAPSTPSPSGEIMRNVSEQMQNPPYGSSPYLGPLHDRPPSAPSPSGDIMRNVGEQTQKPPNGFGHLYVRPPPSVPSGDNKSNAAAAAANVWMSIGAGGFKTPAEKSDVNRNQISSDSLYNTSRDCYEQMFQSHGETAVSGTMHFHPEKRMLPFRAFAPQPVKIISDWPVYSRPMMFPQFVTTDMSRLQVQSPHQGISPHTQQRQKQDKLPPDLNIAFPSPVDSQQPDLALQL
ncbi:Bromodomain and PHD finger-containing protein [Drosera capensis]